MSSADQGSTDREARAKLREARREALNNLDELEASINESASESSPSKASTSSATTVALDKTRSDHDDEASAPVTSTTTATLTSGDAATSSSAAVSADSLGSTGSTSGLYRYKRLHMGISSASEIFTETIRSLLVGCNGVLNMTDDILVHGATEEEHHNNLMHVLQVLEDNGLTINGDKCAFYQKEVIFFGLRFTADGVAPTEDRCKALREATPPANVKELRSLLGMVQFSARFIQELADITEPLWRLTKDGVEWAWSDEQQRAFEALKRAISERCLAFFRRDWTTEVVVDASPVGLGAILAQINPIDASDRRVVCFASRLLTATERRYSQCEKEALAAVYGCERFWLYLFGSQFRLVTDNRAVQLIFGHSVARPPARIERWALRLTQFGYEVRPPSPSPPSWTLRRTTKSSSYSESS